MRKALFLDRDGVVNIEVNYLYKIEDFIFIEGVFELCKYYQDLGYMIFIVTNQSGIARGYYSEDDFHKLTLWMIEEFKRNGISIEKVYFCPHHPDISALCSCRKPNSGMLLKARDEYNIDLENSVLVGDKESDIEAAIGAGMKESYLYDEKKVCNGSRATKIVSKLGEIYSVNTK